MRISPRRLVTSNNLKYGCTNITHIISAENKYQFPYSRFLQLYDICQKQVVRQCGCLFLKAIGKKRLDIPYTAFADSP